MIGDRKVLQFHEEADHERRQARENPVRRIFKLELEISTSTNKRESFTSIKNYTK